jgi:hypothetical protein
MNHRTVGKVTYIHEHPVPDLSGLDDPALQVQPPPIPVIAVGDKPNPMRNKVRGMMLEAGIDDPDQYLHPEPTVTVYYGGPANGYMHSAEPDEFDVWRTPPEPPSPPKRINWWRVAGTSIIIVGSLAVYLFLSLLLAQTWRFWFP